jgi:hypothetical protein
MLPLLSCHSKYCTMYHFKCNIAFSILLIIVLKKVVLYLTLRCTVEG